MAVLVRRHAPEAPAELIDAVWAASDGLPFAVVELARTSVDGHATASSMLPAALSAAEIDALAAAAVLGVAFDTDEFVAVTAGTAISEDDAYAVIDSALAHRVLVRTDTGYAFRHALLREAVLERVSEARHVALHRQAAQALQALERSPARIGFHLVGGGNRSAAVPWMLRAAETEAALGAYREALDTLASVRDQAHGADLARLLGLRADLLMAGADSGAVDAYREALAATTEPALRSRLRARLARAACFAGDLETAAVALDGLTLDGSPDDAELLLAQGNLALFRGDLEAADAAASQARLRVALGVPEECAVVRPGRTAGAGLAHPRRMVPAAPHRTAARRAPPRVGRADLRFPSVCRGIPALRADAVRGGPRARQHAAGDRGAFRGAAGGCLRHRVAR